LAIVRKMTFKAKLFFVLAVPIAVLVVIVSAESKARWDSADAAEHVQALVERAAAAQALAHEVEVEQAMSADATSSTEAQPSDELVDQRERTDALVDDLPGRTDDVRRLLRLVRAQVDGARPPADVVRAYERIASDVVDVATGAFDATGTSDLARTSAAVAALSRAKAAAATEWSVVASMLRIGADEGMVDTLVRANDDLDRQLQAFDGLADDTQRARLQNGLADEDADTAEGAVEAATVAAEAGGALVDPGGWADALAGRLDVLRGVERELTNAVAAQADATQRDAQRDLQLYLLLAAFTVIGASLAALIFARAITGPLRRLTRAAHHLADQQLPSLVEGLRRPADDDIRYLSTAITPIEVETRDELGQLAEAFNSVQRTAVDVAAEQATLLSKGISDIFVNLARRNQVLIDRQIEFLDELESNEQDPTQLEKLYQLDHLATRVRRNAESLLVLAGAEAPRRRGRPVPLVDVVRAAIGEVEDYTRIEVLAFDEVEVAGNAAVDIGHLLAELVENATNFSPPDTTVIVEGRQARNGYVVSITDRGIGMDPVQLGEANYRLASPPPVGLSLSRALGFTVVGRLAARYGLSVRLGKAPTGGIQAVVNIPASLVHVAPDQESAATLPGGGDLPSAAPADSTPQAPSYDIEVEAPTDHEDREAAAAWSFEAVETIDARADTEDDELADAEEASPAPLPVAAAAPAPAPAPRVAALPETLLDAVPQGTALDHAIDRLIDPRSVLEPPALIEPAVPTSALPSRRVAEPAPTEPANGNGLARRTPKARPATASTGSSTRAAIAASRRSPDDVRAMLSRYRQALKNGRDAERASEDGNDR
jgi:signal transduction histidine kinase